MSDNEEAAGVIMASPSFLCYKYGKMNSKHVPYDHVIFQIWNLRQCLIVFSYLYHKGIMTYSYV